jgi:hypothetical protein
MALCIHNCGNTIKKSSRLNECHNCRSALYYWRKKRPAEIVARRIKLDVYASRLEEHFDVRGKNMDQHQKSKATVGNVVAFRRRRA